MLGVTTGTLAILVAQPTDVVKVRMQAAGNKGQYKVSFNFLLCTDYSVLSFCIMYYVLHLNSVLSICTVCLCCVLSIRYCVLFFVY